MYAIDDDRIVALFSHARTREDFKVRVDVRADAHSDRPDARPDDDLGGEDVKRRARWYLADFGGEFEKCVAAH